MAPAVVEQGHPFTHGHFGIPSTLRDADDEDETKPFPRGALHALISPQSTHIKPASAAHATLKARVTSPIILDSDSDENDETVMSRSAFKASPYSRGADGPTHVVHTVLDDDNEEERDQVEDGESDIADSNEVVFLKTRHAFDLDSPPASPLPQHDTQGLESDHDQYSMEDHDGSGAYSHDENDYDEDHPPPSATSDAPSNLYTPLTISPPGSPASASGQMPGAMEDEPVVTLRDPLTRREITPTSRIHRNGDTTPSTPRPTRFTMQQVNDQVSNLMDGIDVMTDVVDNDSFMDESIGDFDDEATGLNHVTDNEPADDAYFTTLSPSSDTSYVLPPLAMEQNAEAPGSPGSSTSNSDSVADNMEEEHEADSPAVIIAPRPMRLHPDSLLSCDSDSDESDDNSVASDHGHVTSTTHQVVEADSPAIWTHNAPGHDSSRLAMQVVDDTVRTINSRPVPVASKPTRSEADLDRRSLSPSPSGYSSAGPEVHPIQRASKSDPSSIVSVVASDSPAPSMSPAIPDASTGPDSISIRIRHSLSPVDSDRSREPSHLTSALSDSDSEDGSESEMESEREATPEESNDESVAESVDVSDNEEDHMTDDSASSVADEAESPTTQSDISSNPPETPEQPVVVLESPTIASSHSTPTKRPLEVDEHDDVKPVAQRRRLLTGENMGMLALGAAIGAVGTVAGLMQLAPQ